MRICGVLARMNTHPLDSKAMQPQNIIKRSKLAVMIGAAACLGFGLFGKQTPVGAAQDQPRRALEFVAAGAPMETRAGVDDGAVFAVHFIGSTRGTLETCG